ncbi:hypothetical protein [Tenuifilum osseticum]|uniref:hypothetical protein n=1 Tax=Tenuifilum osseticum TaxID=3374723 RepID=UPI0034E4B400
MKNITKILITIMVLTSCSNKTVNNNWKGEWIRKKWKSNATLEITKVTSDSIDFFIFAHSGGHTGEIEGKASVDDTIAIFSSQDDMGELCTIEFRLLSDSMILVNQKEGSCFTGLSVTYSGTYINSKLITKELSNKQNLISLEILTSQEDSAFKELVGNSYDLFVNSTQLVSQYNDIDSLKMKVISSGVRGMYTYMENIIMVDSLYRFCAAVIDDNKILYFSNIEEFKNQLPKTIENWMKNFKEYEVIYKTK